MIQHMMIQSTRAITLESCIGHVYIHCIHPKHEFYYSAYRKACVLAATDKVHVCNCGSNRFLNIKGCLASCVNGHHVSEPLLRKHTFLSLHPGTCLSVGRRGVYRSWEECRRRCVLRTESECDETPAAETGSPRQLKHPYFADMQAHGGARCVNVTRRALKSHRILIGSNQFDSLDACRRACPVPGEPQCYGDAERSSVVSPPVRTFHSEWTPLPTWAASSPADLFFLAEAPWQAAAVPSDSSFPRYCDEDGSGPVSEQTLNRESLSKPWKPSRVEFLSVVLGIAFAKLLLGIRLPIVHNSLSPYDVKPDVTDDAFERRLEIAANTVGQRLIPRRVVHPDVDGKGNRKTTTGARTRVRVKCRASNGRTARLLLMRVMTSPVRTPPVAAVTTGAQEEDDVKARRAVTLKSYSGHVYTHCGHAEHEFYCSAYREACVLAATDPVHVCNRDFKWFSSIKSCLASCVNGRHVLDH
ncbi:hypothetical protein MRX96_013256 [Rhipicephalus microplus]